MKKMDLENSTLDLEILDYLAIEEILSLLKSNRLSWNLRRFIKIYLADREFKSFIPLVAITGAAHIILSSLVKCNLLGSLKDNKEVKP